MKIWMMENELEPYKSFYLKNKNELEIIQTSIDKGKSVEKWIPLELICSDKKAKFSDNPQFWPYATLLMVSEDAKNIIYNKYKESIQFLPMVDTEDTKTYYIGNIMNLLDGIDNEKSEFKKLLDIYVVDVIKYVLKENVKDVPIFRLYVQGLGLMTTEIFVNDEFKKLIEDNSLKGFKFVEVFEFE